MRALFLASLAASFLLSSAGALAQADALAEFRNDQAARFNSRGHAKSLGVNFTLRYPRSWRAKEGERPHVLQNFVSTDGSGSNCNVGVRGLGNITDAQARTAVRNLRAQLPADMVFLSGQATTLDGVATTEVQARQSVNRAGNAFEARTLIMMNVSGRNFFTFTCLVGGATQADADRRFAAYLPVFRLIAGSIVFPDQYR
jgi:hypothetical protein